MIYCVLIVFTLLLLLPLVLKAEEKPTSTMYQDTIPQKEYGLFFYLTDSSAEKTSLFSKELFKLTPPLSPKRLERRMKMLWGLNINDYPANSKIVVGGDADTGILYFSISERCFIMESIINSIWGDEVPANYPIDKYALYYRFIMMNDDAALQEYYEKYKDDILEHDFFLTSDFITGHYTTAIFDVKKELIEYIDKYKRIRILDVNSINGMKTNSKVKEKLSNLRLDCTYLYAVNEIKEGREVVFDDINSNVCSDDKIFLDANWTKRVTEGNSAGQIGRLLSGTDLLNPWHPMLTIEQSAAAWLSNMIRFDKKEVNRAIIKELCRDLNSTSFYYRKRMLNFKESLLSNNYYGYTLLREFCENPMRETPILEKIGT
ncbi:hypothetical protein D0T60_18690, partial [Bacteroides sp. 224]|nr:hypothetical protein [Bacteroides sp. 224]